MEQGGRKFIVYKSSAGSGKTYTLVKEYLQIVLQDPDAFRHILAITFTNKAANELKERIIRYLRTLSDPVSYPDHTVEEYLQPDIASSTSLTKELIAERSSRALKLIMHHYSDFAVGTIDSFSHRIVRTFAYDLNIPFSFEVIIDEKDVLVEVVGLLLDKVGVDDGVTRSLVKFVQRKSEEERSWDIEKDLTDFADVLITETSIPYLERADAISFEKVERAEKIIWQYIGSFEKDLSARANILLDLFLDNGLEEGDLAGGKNGLMPWLRRLSDRDLKDLKVPNAVTKALEKANWASGKAVTRAKNIIRQLSVRIETQIEDLLVDISKGKGKYLSFKAMANSLPQMAVLGAMDHELQAYRKENNVLLISEFNRHIHGIVNDQPAPFIYERLGEWYHHFMVDEFQDTSILQWQNLLPLIENSLAEGRLNMVVGDGKQAIYRFRSGDVRQFEYLPRILGASDNPVLKAREESLVRNFELKELKKNYRSSENVVAFNNKLFAAASQWFPEHLSPVYSDVHQEIAGDSSGFVQLEFIQNKDKENPYVEVTGEKVVERIDWLLGRDFCQKDIAVLCRDNKSASLIAGKLLAHGLQVVSAESLLLSSSAEVNFLMAWIKLLANPADEVSMTHILYYLQGNGLLEKNDVEEFLLDNDMPKRWAEPNSRTTFLQKGFRELLLRKFPLFSLDVLYHLDLFHLTVELMSHFVHPAAQNPYLQFFLDHLLELLRRDKQSLSDVLDWWEEKGRNRSVSTPEGLDAIRVMTIHKAKGLEFPVVIYPFADDFLRPTLDHVWINISDELLREQLPYSYIPFKQSLKGSDFEPVYDDEMSQSTVDLVNTFYVAMTRARYELYVYCSIPPASFETPTSIPKMLKQFLMEEGEWQDGKDYYAYGKIKDNVEKEEAEATVQDSPGTPAAGFTNWKKNINLRRSVPEHWSVEDPENAFLFGNTIHYLLSKIKYKDDIQRAVDESLTEGVLDKNLHAKVITMLEGLMTDPFTSWLFDSGWRVNNEREIISAIAGIYRPDRVMFKGNEAVVVDYKTGKTSDYHMEQVRQYTVLLTEMGWKVTKAIILYLGEKVTVVDALEVA